MVADSDSDADRRKGAPKGERRLREVWESGPGEGLGDWENDCEPRICPPAARAWGGPNLAPTPRPRRKGRRRAPLILTLALTLTLTLTHPTSFAVTYYSSERKV